LNIGLNGMLCIAAALLAGCAAPATRLPAPVESRTVERPRPVREPLPAPAPRFEQRGDVEVTVVPLRDPAVAIPQPIQPPLRTGTPEPGAAETPPPRSAPAAPQVGSSGPLVSIAPLPPASSPAVGDLLRDVRRHWADGRHEMAAASLERALRIEPRNAYLWQHLAALRLEQGRAAQAEQFAAKSNSFAGDSPALLLRNWRIIAAARRHAGNERGAREAENRAVVYERAGR
jgi:hypothetical protein